MSSTVSSSSQQSHSAAPSAKLADVGSATRRPAGTDIVVLDGRELKDGVLRGSRSAGQGKAVTPPAAEESRTGFTVGAGSDRSGVPSNRRGNRRRNHAEPKELD